jgi:hypothetical protein
MRSCNFLRVTWVRVECSVRLSALAASDDDEIEALVVKSVRGHLNLTTEIEDAALVHTHVVRVEIQSDQLVIELANTSQHQMLGLPVL